MCWSVDKDLPMKWQYEILIVVVALIITASSFVDAFTTVSSIATQKRLKSVLLQINDDSTFEDDVITSQMYQQYIEQRRRREFIISRFTFLKVQLRTHEFTALSIFIMLQPPSCCADSWCTNGVL